MFPEIYSIIGAFWPGIAPYKLYPLKTWGLTCLLGACRQGVFDHFGEVECSSIWGLVGKGFFFLLNLITKLHCSRVTATSMEVCYGTKLREAYRV